MCARPCTLARQNDVEAHCSNGWNAANLMAEWKHAHCLAALVDGSRVRYPANVTNPPPPLGESLSRLLDLLFDLANRPPSQSPFLRSTSTSPFDYCPKLSAPREPP
jgi:hypothetical protein